MISGNACESIAAGVSTITARQSAGIRSCQLRVTATERLEARDAVNRRTVVGTLAQPAHARALRIEVHERRPVAVRGVARSEVARDRGLAQSRLSD